MRYQIFYVTLRYERLWICPWIQSKFLEHDFVSELLTACRRHEHISTGMFLLITLCITTYTCSFSCTLRCPVAGLEINNGGGGTRGTEVPQWVQGRSPGGGLGRSPQKLTTYYENNYQKHPLLVGYSKNNESSYQLYIWLSYSCRLIAFL